MQDYYPRVLQAVAGDGFTVYAYFSDGSVRLADVGPVIAKGGVFSPLARRELFVGRLTVIGDTVAWDMTGDRDPSACLDLDPFFLYAAPVVPDPLAAQS